MSYYMTKPNVRYYTRCRRPEQPLYEPRHTRQTIPLQGLGWGTFRIGGGIDGKTLAITGAVLLGTLGLLYAYWPEPTEQDLYRGYLRAQGRA